MNVVELFSGSGTISQEFKRAGHNTFSIDIRRRRKICEPDLRKNVLDITRKDIPFNSVDVIWASPPCDVWSYATGDIHWDKHRNPKTDKCNEFIKILKKCLDVVQEINPKLFFIENPRGRLRYHKSMIDFLVKNNGMIKELTYSSYGFPTTKPTNIFTNAHTWKPKDLDRFGRGAKNNCKGLFNNLTKCQRQKVPGTLAKEIRIYCEANILTNNPAN